MRILSRAIGQMGPPVAVAASTSAMAFSPATAEAGAFRAIVFAARRCCLFISATRVAKKLKLQERRALIPSRRSLAACRPLHFFGAINGALCGSADKWGETHGVG